MQLQSDDELLEGIGRWVEIESQTAHTDGVNRMMDDAERLFRETGAIVERITGGQGYADCLSVSSPWGGDSPGVLVLSHLDTVHPEGTLQQNPYRIDGDKVYGPGIYDMKGGAYLGFAAYQSLVREGRETPLPIRFLYVSDEEIGSRFSRPLIEAAGARAKFALVTEPARQGGKVVTGRKGTARYQINAHGRPSHSGSLHAEGRSAIREMARLVLAIEDRTDYARDITFNVGEIKGGSTANTVPEFCWANIDLRVATMADFEEMDAFIRGLSSTDPDVKLTIAGQLNRPPYKKTPGIQALFDHARKLANEIGFDMEDTATGGGSDGSFIAARVPTLDGLGVDGAGAHTLHEHLDKTSLQPRLALMRRLMETLE
ncbi:MAG: M20 family metallopeptidase [Alphaproteobacteria bacterium]|nr:M20 family metallopeptidase [Alphaproteobacteria bacterium]